MVTILLAALGAAMGSFAGALVWRLHNGRNFVSDRSECEHCHHKLQWADLVPIVSWLWLRNRCRYCHARIGWQAIALELGMAAAFAMSYAWWPYPLVAWQADVLFGIWLLQVVLLVALLVYDVRWMLLPDKLVWPLTGIAVAYVALQATIQPVGPLVLGALLGLLPITGLYGLLYVLSKGAWVGLGDVKLGIFMGLMLGWPKAFLALALANAIGFVILVPGLLSGRVNRKSRVPFGPFLIIGFFIAILFGDGLIRWYFAMTLLGPG